VQATHLRDKSHIPRQSVQRLHTGNPDESGHGVSRVDVGYQVACPHPLGVRAEPDISTPGKIASVTAGSASESNVYDASGNLLLQTDSTTGSTLFLGATELHETTGSSTASAVRTYSANGTPIAERTTAVGFRAAS
jgi:hypothetical protein